MVLLAFGFEPRVGKLTAGLHLQQEFGGRILSFGVPLRTVRAYVENLPQKKERCCCLRTCRRSKRSNIYVDLLRNHLNAEAVHLYVTRVESVRQFESLRLTGFCMIRIVRNAAPSGQSALLDANWDVVVENNGSLEDFHASLDKVMNEELMRNISRT